MDLAGRLPYGATAGACRVEGPSRARRGNVASGHTAAGRPARAAAGRPARDCRRYGGERLCRHACRSARRRIRPRPVVRAPCGAARSRHALCARPHRLRTQSGAAHRCQPAPSARCVMDDRGSAARRHFCRGDRRGRDAAADRRAPSAAGSGSTRDHCTVAAAIAGIRRQRRHDALARNVGAWQRLAYRTRALS